MIKLNSIKGRFNLFIKSSKCFKLLKIYYKVKNIIMFKIFFLI